MPRKRPVLCNNWFYSLPLTHIQIIEPKTPKPFYSAFMCPVQCHSGICRFRPTTYEKYTRPQKKLYCFVRLFNPFQQSSRIADRQKPTTQKTAQNRTMYLYVPCPPEWHSLARIETHMNTQAHTHTQPLHTMLRFMGTLLCKFMQCGIAHRLCVFACMRPFSWNVRAAMLFGTISLC